MDPGGGAVVRLHLGNGTVFAERPVLADPYPLSDPGLGWHPKAAIWRPVLFTGMISFIMSIMYLSTHACYYVATKEKRKKVSTKFYSGESNGYKRPAREFHNCAHHKHD